jgi:hypothetical protein
MAESKNKRSLYSRMIGGLLGEEELAGLSEEERKRLEREAGLSAVRGMLSGTGLLGGIESYRGARQELRKKAEQEATMRRATQDVNQAQAAIAGRMGARGADVGEQTQLEEVRPMSGMNLQALMASPAGAAALQANPMLKSMADERMKPEDYTVQNVSGVGLVAVNKRNPRDTFIVQKEARQPKEGPQPTLRQVRLANGMVQDTWIAPGQASGTPVGAPYMPGTGKGGEGETLNARQQSGVNMTQDAAYTYASNLTGVGVEELKKKTPAEIETLIRNRGGRFLQGGVARTVSGLPVIGDFAKTIVEASNADLMGPATTGGSGIAMLQNPTGPITGTDVEVGIRQFPNPMLPVNVQAQMIRSIIERGGRVERYDRNGNPIK